MALTDPTIAKFLCGQQYGPTLLAWYTPGSRKSLFVRGESRQQLGWPIRDWVDQGIQLPFTDSPLSVSPSVPVAAGGEGSNADWRGFYILEGWG